MDEHGIAIPEQGERLRCFVLRQAARAFIAQSMPHRYAHNLTHEQVMDRYAGNGLDNPTPLTYTPPVGLTS